MYELSYQILVLGEKFNNSLKTGLEQFELLNQRRAKSVSCCNPVYDLLIYVVIEFI